MSTGTVGVVVAFSPLAGQVERFALSLPAGSTVDDALAASGLLDRHPQADGLPVGIWGRKVERSAVLREHDRIELYRPLQCDPKEARRQRYRQVSGTARR